MTSYLLITSRDPFESQDVARWYDLAADLAGRGHPVTLFLVQDGTFAARANRCSGALATLATKGVELLADEFSLRERGIAADRLVAGVSAAPLDVVLERLAAGHKALWH